MSAPAPIQWAMNPDEHIVTIRLCYTPAENPPVDFRALCSCGLPLHAPDFHGVEAQFISHMLGASACEVKP